MNNKLISVLVLSIVCSGCASAKKTYAPDGSSGYSIDCSGSIHTWGSCYEKAGKICGSRGYEILLKSGDTGAEVSGNKFGVYGGSVITRNMVIKCKEKGP